MEKMTVDRSRILNIQEICNYIAEDICFVGDNTYEVIGIINESKERIQDSE